MQLSSEIGFDNHCQNFQDHANKTALPVIHLIDAMRNGVINYDVVKSGSELSLQVKAAAALGKLSYLGWNNSPSLVLHQFYLLKS